MNISGIEHMEFGFSPLQDQYVCIKTLNKFYKSVFIFGVEILPKFEWSNEADGKLTTEYVLSDLIKPCVIYKGEVGNTNHFGYVINGSKSLVTSDYYTKNFRAEKKLVIKKCLHTKLLYFKITEFKKYYSTRIEINGECFLKESYSEGVAAALALMTIHVCPYEQVNSTFEEFESWRAGWANATRERLGLE